MNKLKWKTTIFKNLGQTAQLKDKKKKKQTSMPDL